MTNEQKFKTPEERHEAFRRFCREHNNCDKGCNNCPVYSMRGGCRFAWLTLEAEEEKPLPCPLCGGEAVAVQPWLTGGASVMCKKCGTFIWAPTQAEAIATWNRSAK